MIQWSDHIGACWMSCQSYVLPRALPLDLCSDCTYQMHIMPALMQSVCRAEFLLSGDGGKCRVQRSIVLSPDCQHMTRCRITVLTCYAALVLHIILVGPALPSRCPGAAPRFKILAQCVRSCECCQLMLQVSSLTCHLRGMHAVSCQWWTSCLHVVASS